MWGLDLSQMDAKIVQRLKINLECDELYFPNDEFQALPKDGYAKLVDNILNHKNITIDLSVNFEKKNEKLF